MTGSKVLVRARPEDQDTKFQSEARWYLQKSRVWVYPGKLLFLTKLVVERDSAIRASGESRAPFKLQAEILADIDKLKEATISKGVVRKFIRVIHEGGAFQTEGGLRQGDFSGEYQNSLNQTIVLKAYVSACVQHISAAMALAAGHSAEVAQLLLGQHIESGESLVKQAILDQTEQAIDSRALDRKLSESTAGNVDPG